MQTRSIVLLLYVTCSQPVCSLSACRPRCLITNSHHFSNECLVSGQILSTASSLLSIFLGQQLTHAERQTNPLTCRLPQTVHLLRPCCAWSTGILVAARRCGQSVVSDCPVQYSRSIGLSTKGKRTSANRQRRNRFDRSIGWSARAHARSCLDSV